MDDVPQVIRSIYPFGSPIQVEIDGELVRYSDNADRPLEQQEHFNSKIVYPLNDHLSNYTNPDDGFSALTRV